MLNGFKVKSFTPFPNGKSLFFASKKTYQTKKTPTNQPSQKKKLDPTNLSNLILFFVNHKKLKKNTQNKNNLKLKKSPHFPSLNSCNSPSARWHRLWYSGASDAGPPPRGKASDVSSCSSSAAAESWRKAKEASSKRSYHQPPTTPLKTGWDHPKMTQLVHDLDSCSYFCGHFPRLQPTRRSFPSVVC